LRIKTDFPRPLGEAEDTWIPLSDGCRLSARVWRPQDSDDDPVPALLEYLPYRKDDATAVRDSVRHPYFAGHGYASVRVDMRGSGASDGILEDEYLPQEQEDGVEVIAWLAAQPWCTGDVGMIGLSWGGFNALQVAALRPPELKAIVTLCSTDDRYALDVHYMGGCVLADFMLPWAASMLVLNARPPDPALAGARWREQWLDRMERTPSFIEAWLAHQRRDAYWEQGSVCEDYGRIACPVYAVGGWADAYRNAVPRLLAGLPGPRKGLIGPWAHLYPEQGVPGPAIGFLQECLRWWDHWLRGRDTGIMDEPILRVWMQDAVPPQPFYEERAGRWIAEAAWPSPNLGARS
jgi:putative CocE/NonD family hydrolase